MPVASSLSPFQKHVEKWSNCNHCDLCKTRNKIVLARGSLPADVMFCGEAPGKSEDVLGVPFVGPAGKLFDQIIKQAWDRFSTSDGPSYCLSNLVACIPVDDEGNKFGEPPEESIIKCSPRLNELVQLCKPKLVILVGKLASKHITGQKQFGDPWLPKGESVAFVSVTHPAAILRADVSRQALDFQRCIVTISDALEDTFGEK